MLGNNYYHHLYHYSHSFDNMSSGNSHNNNNNNNFMPMNQSPDNDFPDDSESNFDQFPDLSMFDEWEPHDDVSALMPPSESMPNHPIYQANEVDHDSGGSSSQFGGLTSVGENESGRERKETKERVAFKTQSEVEILDDGFKWRKYGKKMVKNSPNPRNYYRCSVEGCPVKKRVERDREDPRFVITTYEGIHNHQSTF